MARDAFRYLRRRVTLGGLGSARRFPVLFQAGSGESC